MERFPVAILALTILFMCGCSQCDNSQVSTTLNEDDHKPTPHRDIEDQLDGPLDPVYQMTEWALESVIQTDYLTDLEYQIGESFEVPQDFVDSFEEHWEQWLVYFIGFTVLAAIGVLLILILPLVGMMVACCRCCGNCGGKARPMEGKCSGCKRVCCGITFFVVTSAITIGVICMFAFNTEIHRRIHTEPGNIWDELSENLDKVDKYFDGTVEEMDVKILDEYIDKKNVLINMLEQIPTDAVEVIDNETQVMDDIDKLLRFSQSLTSLNESLVIASGTEEDLNVLLSDLTIELEYLKNETITSLKVCTSVECENVRNATEGLFVNMTTSSIVLENVTLLVQQSVQQNLSEEIEASSDELDKIVQAINSSMQDEIELVEEYADNIQAEIETFINDTEENLDKVDIHLAVDTLQDVKADISEAVEITYWAVVAFGVPICIIVFCSFIGLLLGITCPRPSPNGGCCSADRTMGSDALLAGIGFTFIFYWIYAMVVLVMFLGGGVTHTEVCRHLVNYDELKSAEVLNVLDRMATYQLNESLELEISPFYAYQSCAENQSFYKALELANNGYNISEIIDTSEIKEAIDDIKKVKVEIPVISIMNDTVEEVLLDLGEEFDRLDFALYNEELDGAVTTVDLLYIVDLLSATIESNSTVNKTEIESLIDQFTDAHNQSVIPAKSLAQDLMKELRVIEDLLPDTPLANITSALREDEDFINTNAVTLVGEFINTTADELYTETVAFTDNMISTVENDLGRCEPLYDALTGSIDSVCVKTLYPLNGFWFSLGWCLMFLLPSIVIAFILADEYRKAHAYIEGIDTTFDEPGQAGYDAYAGVPDYWTFDNGSSTSGVQMYQLPRVQLQPNTTKKLPAKPHQSDGMAAFDNPIYSNDDEMKIPRPTVIPTPYYPPSTLHRKQQHGGGGANPSPPPSYRDAVDSDDRISYDENYDTKM